MSLLPARLRRSLANFRRGLGAKLTLRMIVWALLLSLVIAALQLWLDYRRVLRDIDKQLTHIEKAILPVINEAMWAFARDQVHMSVNSIALLPRVASVRLSEINQLPIELGDSQSLADGLTRGFVLQHKGGDGMVRMGTLEVSFDLGAVRDELLGQYRFILLNVLLAVGTLLLLMLVLFERHVTRHLRRAADHVSALAPENLDRELNLARPRLPPGEGDEFDLLALGISQMQHSLRESISSLERDIGLRREVEAKVRELNLSLEEKVVQRTRELAAAQNDAEQVLKLTHSAFWTKPLGTDEVNFSDRAAELLGIAWRADGKYSMQGDIYAHLRQTGPAQVEDLLRLRDELVDSQLPRFDRVLSFRRPNDGRLIWLQITAHTETDDTGERILRGAIQDVTLDKQAELALNEAREQAEQVLNLTRAGFYTRKVATGEIYLDDHCREMLGLDSRPGAIYSVIDDYLANVIAADADTVDILARRERRLREGLWDERPYMVPFRRPSDGQRIWVQIAPGSCTSESGGMVIRGALQDVTDQMHIQRSLADARDAAEVASKAKSDFLANMSHEIRTPLNGMLGMVQLLERSGLDARQEAYIERLRYSADSLLGIINDILDFSKIEAGQLEMESIRFDFEQLLDHTLSMLSVRADEKGLELVLDVSPDLPQQFIGDALRIGQILNNLGNNAIKFTAVGSIVLRVRAEEISAGGLTLRIDVEDTGIGMTPEQQERLFESFHQADSSISRRFGGSGLGLAICKRLVEHMDGTIWVSSQPGHGSVFSFALPMRLAESSADGSSDLLPGTSQPPRRASWSRRVLVVDDNATVRAVAGALLGSYGDEPLLAESAEAAKALLSDPLARIDLVLIDWRMPAMDGLALVRWLGEQGAADGLRGGRGRWAPEIIFMVPQSDLALRQQAHGLGVRHFLVKPFTAASLFELLGAASGSPGQSQPLPVAARPSAGVLHGRHVLLVDDNRINQEVARHLLESEGLIVTTAVNGEEALRAVASSHDTGARPVDLVLMDVQMPVMDGYTATRTLRADPRNAGLPIVAMTAHGLGGDRERSLASGMNDHLVKPFVFEDLLQILLRLLPAQTATEPDHRRDSRTAEGAERNLTVPESLVYMDTTAALARLRGRVGSYLSLVQIFVAEYPPYVADYRQGDDPGQRAALAHKLKGTAGSLGLAGLQSAAADHEQRLRAGAAIAPAEIDALCQLLQSALDEARCLLAVNPGS